MNIREKSTISSWILQDSKKEKISSLINNFTNCNVE